MWRRTRTSRLAHVGTYERMVGASLERVWENVFDWEHLPWLHRSTFTEMTLLARGPDFWRASVTLAALVVRRMVIELRAERPRLRWVTRTIEGFGAGSEIWTRLEPMGERRTGIRVEFHVAGAARLLGRWSGAGYERLYARLWDEDEAMMRHRQAVLDDKAERRAKKVEGDEEPPAATSLGRESALRERLPCVVDTAKGPVRVVDVAEQLYAHRTECPHLGGPLEHAPVVDGTITCPWHGYRFDLASGAPLGDHRCRLLEAPCVEIDATTRDVSLVWRGARDRS